jgi:hypothetical protein
MGCGSSSSAHLSKVQSDPSEPLQCSGESHVTLAKTPSIELIGDEPMASARSHKSNFSLTKKLPEICGTPQNLSTPNEKHNPGECRVSRMRPLPAVSFLKTKQCNAEGRSPSTNREFASSTTDYTDQFTTAALRTSTSSPFVESNYPSGSTIRESPASKEEMEMLNRTQIRETSLPILAVRYKLDPQSVKICEELGINEASDLKYIEKIKLESACEKSNISEVQKGRLKQLFEEAVGGEIATIPDSTQSTFMQSIPAPLREESSTKTLGLEESLWARYTMLMTEVGGIILLQVFKNCWSSVQKCDVGAEYDVCGRQIWKSGLLSATWKGKNRHLEEKIVNSKPDEWDVSFLHTVIEALYKKAEGDRKPSYHGATRVWKLEHDEHEWKGPAVGTRAKIDILKHKRNTICANSGSVGMKEVAFKREFDSLTQLLIELGQGMTLKVNHGRKQTGAEYVEEQSRRIKDSETTTDDYERYDKLQSTLMAELHQQRASQDELRMQIEEMKTLLALQSKQAQSDYEKKSESAELYERSLSESAKEPEVSGLESLDLEAEMRRLEAGALSGDLDLNVELDRLKSMMGKVVKKGQSKADIVFEKFDKFWRRVAKIAALRCVEGDILLEKELKFLSSSVLDGLEDANWSVRKPVRLIVLNGERSLERAARDSDSNSRRQLERLLALVKDEEAELHRKGETGLFTVKPVSAAALAVLKYDRLLQLLAWLALEQPGDKRDKACTQVREIFASELDQCGLTIDVLDALWYPEGPRVLDSTQVPESSHTRTSAESMVDRLPWPAAPGTPLHATVRTRLGELLKAGRGSEAARRAAHNMAALKTLGTERRDWDKHMGGDAGQMLVEHKDLWERLGQLVLAKDLARLSKNRVCEGDEEDERRWSTHALKMCAAVAL